MPLDFDSLVQKSRANADHKQSPSDRITPKKLFRTLRSRPEYIFLGSDLYPDRAGERCKVISVADEGNARICVEFEDSWRGIVEREELR